MAQCFNASMLQCFNASMLQCFNGGAERGGCRGAEQQSFSRADATASEDRGWQPQHVTWSRGHERERERARVLRTESSTLSRQSSTELGLERPLCTDPG
eukprot:231459-Rhodomonas_salina.2